MRSVAIPLGPKPTAGADGTAVHHVICNLCEATCGLDVTVRGREILDIRGNKADVFSHGHVCPKALAIGDIQNDPDRLSTPVRRVGTDWQPIGWGEAIEFAAKRLAAIRAEHGGSAVAVYLGNPSVHSLGGLTHGTALSRVLGTKNHYSATSVDQLPQHVVSYLMYGHQFLLPVPDIDRVQHLLVLGANPLVSNGSLMTAPDMAGRLKALRARGGRLVVIDPRRTETAAAADEYHPIRPGTDAALLLALLHVITHEIGVDPQRTAHLPAPDPRAVAEACARFTPEWAADRCGIPAQTIRAVAADLAGAERAAVYGRLGVSVQQFGSVCHWAIQTLNVLTGNLDREGGTLFPDPAIDLVSRGLIGRGHLGKWRSRVRGLPEFGGELPVAGLADEITTPGKGQVRALVTVAGNPVSSTPSGAKLDAALSGLEFMVSVDFYVNETTRHADLILPPTPLLERDHYDLALNQLAVRNNARFARAVFDRPADARHDWEIFRDLVLAYDRARGVGLRSQLSVAGLTRQARMRLSPRAIVAGLLASSPDRVSVFRSINTPGGADLGPLRPGLTRKIKTRDKTINLLPAEILADLDRVAALEPPADGELLLIGRRHLRSNNSWLHNSRRMVKGQPRHQLLMNPKDMAERGVADGDLVDVRSGGGAVRVAAKATEDVMAGVVSLPHGFGQARDGVRLSVASTVPGISMNDVTDSGFVDAVSGNAALNGVPVTVSPVTADEAAPDGRMAVP
jgi:anaerobic selenocysteine-containing dehydrogenase